MKNEETRIVLRTLVIRGHPDWVERTLASGVTPDNPKKCMWGTVTEVNRKEMTKRRDS